MTNAADTQALYQAGMDAAVAQAEKSLAEGGIPIGSAIVSRAGEIIAAGHNRRVQDGDPTAHGEMTCIRNAGRRRDWRELILVTTLSPCAMCTGTIILYGFQTVVIGESETFQGREDWLREAGVAIVALNDARCKALMQQFIADRPDLWDEDIGR
jgi:cytosine deaminase